MTTQTLTSADEQSPRFEGRALRDAFGSFATGVTIVTTAGPDGLDIGLTANSFSSVSLDPPMVLWSLARTSMNMDAFRNGEHFAVHILSAEQEALSTRFASKGVDRFEGLTLDRGPDNIPMLPDCMARFACKVAYQYEGGDHVIFVGEIVDFRHSTQKPLVFHGGRYGMLLPKQADTPDELDDEFSNLSADDLLYQVSNAYFRTRQTVIDKLEANHWTAEEYAVLSIIGREDGLCMPEIVSRSEKVRGKSISTSIIQKLISRGLLHDIESYDGQVTVKLTADGRRAALELMAIRKASESEVQGNLDPSEVQLLKHLLARLEHATPTATAT